MSCNDHVIHILLIIIHMMIVIMIMIRLERPWHTCDGTPTAA